MSKLEELKKEVENLNQQIKEMENKSTLKMYYLRRKEPVYMGDVGFITNIKDSNGNNLHTGDIIRLWSSFGEDLGQRAISYDEDDKETFVPGIKNFTEEQREKLFTLEKLKDYSEVRKGYRTEDVVFAYSKEQAKEIRQKEVEYIKEVMKTEDFSEMLKEMLENLKDNLED